MIVDLIFISLSVTFLFLFGILSVIGFVIPVEVATAVAYFVGKLHYLEIVFPISTLMNALGVYLVFIFYYYLVKLVLYLLSWLPFLKVSADHPRLSISKKIGSTTISKSGSSTQKSEIKK